jgi:hypothetical protein
MTWTRSLLTMAMLSVAGALAAQQPAKNPLEGNPEAIRAGMGLFRGRCGDCHGIDARGVRGPDITQIWASGRTDEGLFKTIKEGISVNPRTKQKIFPGMAPGSEITWTAIAGKQPFTIPVEFYRYFVHGNADWDWTTFDLDKDVAAGNEKFGALMNATDPDLGAFKKRGGKLIMYHGWNDQLIQPQNTIDYFTSVQKALGERETDDFARLFMAPGMTHCAGGVGPSSFDAVTALEEWVEKGIKPAELVASRMAGGGVERTRPLCPCPQVATYKGSGSIDEAASFVCK